MNFSRHCVIVATMMLLLPGADGVVRADAFEQDSFEQLSVTQWVTPDDNDQIKVRVVIPQPGGTSQAVQDASVRLLGADGYDQTATVNESGVATLQHVSAGVYAIVGRSKDVFGCYSMHVVDPDDASSGLYPSLAVVSCGLESRERFTQAVEGYFPLAYELQQLRLNPQRLGGIVDHVRGNELFRVTRIGESMLGTIYQPTDHGSMIDQQDREGRLDPAERANVFLYQAGKRVRHEMTDRNGKFEFKNLSTGVYSLISVGPDGIAAVGFELVDPLASAASLTSDGYQFIAKHSPAYCGFAMQVVPCCESLQIPTESCCEPVACCEPIECCEPVECCEEVEPVAAVAAPAAPAAPAAGGGGIAGGVTSPPLGGIIGVTTAALIVNSKDNPAPFRTPSPASPDTLHP